MSKNVIYSINGPVVTVKDATNLSMLEMVYVGEKKLMKCGDRVSGGMIYATLPETDLIEHRCMVPPYMEGEVVWCAENGSYHLNDEIVKIKSEDGSIHCLTLCQKWPIKTARPVKERLPLQFSIRCFRLPKAVRQRYRVVLGPVKR